MTGIGENSEFGAVFKLMQSEEVSEVGMLICIWQLVSYSPLFGYWVQ